ncbi:hypothetical protein VPNG_08650 [Cytospora leucostoma]|uniref:Uncharacterized protein n=1 Tax=Cytospora leucostoma TaxID=1230097 RepID=A0A423W3C5_9PEZI|nr:hypothetical protein VPNG_08650 [Cytospora leucostoma]
MDTNGLIHRVEWTPATLTEEPLNFENVVFLVSDREPNATVSAFQEQLAGEGYKTALVSDVTGLETLLSPGTIVVHIPHAAQTKDDIYGAVTTSCNTLIAAAQQLQSLNKQSQYDGNKSPKLISLATRDFGTGDLVCGSLYGLARVLKSEAADLFGGLFEEDQGQFPTRAIQHAQGFDIVRVCEGVAQTASLQSIEDEPNSKTKQLSLNPDGTYLITGGTGGMGLEIASWMQQHGARNLILVSRSGLPPVLPGTGEPASKDAKELVSRISDLKSKGATVHVLAVDVGQPGADSILRQSIDSLHVPPIKGVVHAAGTADYHTLERCAPSEVASVLAPKVLGALNIDSLFPIGTLDFLFFTSSIGQLVGFPGQLSYAPANAFLDALAAYRRRQGDNSTSIQWTSWRGVGLMAQSKSATRMITRGMQARGIDTISKDEAFAAWDRIASLESDHAAVVRAVEVEAFDPPRHPILRDITPRKGEDRWKASATSNIAYPEHAVAVVGMSCRTAAGDTPEDLWQVIQKGISLEREIDMGTAGTKGKLWGNFLSNSDSFDHQFFKKTKREAAALDPHQLLLLETTYHALESAGWLGNGQDREAETHERSESSHTTACFIGMNSPDYPLNLACHPASPYTGFGMLRAFVAGRLSHYFGWTGPSHVIDTACSSGMVAIHQACRAIQLGECTRAVAGGVNLMTNTVLTEAMRVGGFLNETGPCKTFDARADGYCRGEAVGVVVLKPLHRALADGDEIHGVLLSTGNNQNINSTSITNPVLESQSSLYRDVLARAGVNPADVSYVEAHGTGTRAGDPVEVQGIRQVLGGENRHSTLHIGAVKPNVGHSESASGVVSLIKVLLMMKYGKITPQANFQTLNPNIGALEPDRMAISTSLQDWRDNLRLAVVNSYGASGNNAAAVVAPPPPPSSRTSPAVPTPSLSALPVYVSAASKASLSAYLAKLRDRFEAASPGVAPHLAFALATKQNHHLQHVFSTTVTSLDDLKAQLSDPERNTTIAPQQPKPVVLLFSGQNGNIVQSAKPLYDSSLLFRTHLHRCDEVMQSLGLPSLFPSALQGIQGDSDIVLRHALMFSIQYSCGMSWIDSGVKPQAVCGHSFGEWAALTVSGAMTLEAGLKLVTGVLENMLTLSSRAEIIQRLWGEDTGSMIAIETNLVSTNRTPAEYIKPFYEEHPDVKLDIACYNGPDCFVVAGRTPDIELLESYLIPKKSGGEKLRFKVLKGMHAYHSVMADSIVDESAKLSASIPFQDPILPFESCHKDIWAGPGSNVIARNTRGPVYFTQAISRIVDRLGSCTFLESGFGGPIITMARNALPVHQTQAQHSFVAIASKDPVRSLADAAVSLWRSGQSDVQFWPFHKSQRSSYRSIDLPPYEFEKHSHWLQYTGLSSDKASGQSSVEQATATSGVCPHCSKTISDEPYIVQDKSRSQGTDTAVFKIDPRNKRYRALVGGHAVVGSPICPAAMYLELASHGVLLLQGPETSKTTPELSAKALAIKAPLGLDTQRAIELTLKKKTTGAWDFELSSKKNGKPTSHATGVIYLQGSSSIIEKEQDERDKWARLTSLLKDDADTDALRGRLIYKIFGKMAKYSPPYRGVRYLAGKGDEGAGDIDMPADELGIASGSPNDTIGSPVVMDNFLQVPGAFMHSLRSAGDDEGDDSAMSYICTGMGSAGPLNTIPGNGKYGAYTRILRESKKETLLDLFAFDKESKKIVWYARELSFTKVPRNSLVKALAGANPDMKLNEQPASQSKATPAARPDSLTPKSAPSKGPSVVQTKPSRTETNPVDAVLSSIREVLSKSLEVPIEEVTKQALLEDLGADSLVMSEILTGISDKLRVELSIEDFATVTDVASLCLLVSTRRGDHGVAAASDGDNEARPEPDLVAADDANSGWQDTILRILSQSLDVPVAEMKKDSRLEDLGADSLVSGEIIGNLNEAFGLDISSVEFASLTDVASLYGMIAGALKVDPVQIATNSDPVQVATNSDWQDTILRILSQSLDVPVEEMQLDSRLEDLGADSLVSGEIIGNLNEAFGLDIESVEFTSLTDVASLYGMIAGALNVDPVQIATPSSSGASPTSASFSGSVTALSANTGTTTPTTTIKTVPSQDNTGFIHTAFQETRRSFDAHAKDTGYIGYWDEVYPRQLDTVVAFIVEAFDKLGCPIKDFKQGGRLPPLPETLPMFHREVPRLWEILEEAGVVEKGEDGFLRGPEPLQSSNAGKKSAKELSTDLISDFPKYASTHGLPDILGPHLAECLTGKADPVSLLFGSEKGRKLLQDYYSDAPDLRAATLVLCDFISAAIHAHKPENNEPFRVLEVGAGTGGTTKHLIPLLQATGIPFTYTFTELSVSLLARARKTTFKDVQQMDFLKLNIEEEPPEHLLGQYHAVVSTNCVHATRDLRRSLTNIHKLVRPDGGCVALSEVTQKLPWYDLVWGLLDGWWLFEDGREYALQSPWAWERAMRDAGFAHVDWSEGATRESRGIRIICGMTGEPERPCPAKATSTLLHRGTSGARSLFLLPDGFGSGAVFGALQPSLGSLTDTSVYVLNSPFLRNKPGPERLPALEELAAAYVAEIKRRQPVGPYLLGGYSIGGLVAFEAARQLLEDGSKVEKLVLIDTACPTYATAMPDALVGFLTTIADKPSNATADGAQKLPPITNDHFKLAMQQLQAYKVSDLPGRKAQQIPQVVLVSARAGVDKQDTVPRPRVLPDEQRLVDWFLDDRKDEDAPYGWNELLGGVTVIRAEGHHFSMMGSPMVDGWGRELAGLLGV